ncbi:MAG: YggS family pyridoxal phosphate-dependent enzyme [Flavobacteriales bacterium]|jgi:pyridoxal phosphate enzyme (YggS family)
MNIARNLSELQRAVPKGVKIIAVSKTKPVDLLKAAYDAGQRAFGENYVQELVDKYPQLPQDIEWHFIGHLQSNKVKNIAPFVSYIHAVDSEKLLREIDKQSEKNNRVINCLLQFHIADEESKFGFQLDSYKEVLSAIPFAEFKHIRICGVMGMASFVQNQLQIESEFNTLKNIFEELKSSLFKDNSDFVELSMGMSGDWPLAVDKGSTMIRIGSSIFGNRI